MNIGLFAAGTVGKEIAIFFGDHHEPLACLILDSNDQSGMNREIIARSGLNETSRIFYSDSLDDPRMRQNIQDLELDLILLAWWPYILKKELIQIARMGCLNFHPSYLPYNRGKHYNFWTIVENTPFGVTLHWVNEAVDAGDIAWQTRIEKCWEDTGETLYRKAQQEIVKLFKERFCEIKKGQIPRNPQELSLGRCHRANELESASRIDLDKQYTARDLLNLLRARTFPPHPAAWFVDRGVKYEIRTEIKRISDATNQ